MPTRNVNLTDHQDRFVTQALTTGRYLNASEVVREGLRLLERREAYDSAKLARLRAAVVDGEAALISGDCEEVEPRDLEIWLTRVNDSTTR